MAADRDGADRDGADRGGAEWDDPDLGAAAPRTAPGSAETRRRDAWIESDPARMPLGRLLSRTGQAVADYHRQTVSRHGLSATGLGVLAVLAAGDGLAHRDLAAELGVTPATLTPVLDALEADGAVSRQRDSEDRRVVRLLLEPAGRDRLRRVLDRVATELRDRLPALDPARERVVRGYLLAVLDAVEPREPG